MRGWEHGSGRQLLDVAAELALPGVAAFVVTDISRDGTLGGPDLDGLGACSQAATRPGRSPAAGVGTLDDLACARGRSASPARSSGKAIYEGRFTVEEAVHACAP